MKARLILLGFLTILFLQSNSCKRNPYKITDVKSVEAIWWNELNNTWQELFMRESNHLGEKVTQQTIEEILLLEKFNGDHYPLGETALDPLKLLVHLKEISVGSTYISQIEAVRFLPNLEHINLVATSVSDLSPLSKHEKLISVYIQQTLITDIGPLSKSKNLQVLYIDQTEVSSIKPIMHHQNLSILSIGNCPIPEKEILEFRELNPECQIIN